MFSACCCTNTTVAVFNGRKINLNRFQGTIPRANLICHQGQLSLIEREDHRELDQGLL